MATSVCRSPARRMQILPAAMHPHHSFEQAIMTHLQDESIPQHVVSKYFRHALSQLVGGGGG